MRTVTIAFICILGNDGPEMFFVTMRVTFGLLAFITGTIITVLNVLLLFELLQGQSFLIRFKLFEMFLNADLVFVLEERRGTKQGLNDDFVLLLLGGLFFLLLKCHDVGG
jgi:hypothetical protein